MSMLKTTKISILISFILFNLTSCSNRTLSYFFDGALADNNQKQPALVAPSLVRSDTTAGKTTKENILIDAANVYHLDYRQKKCEKCHQVEDGYRLKQRQPALCYQCHKNFNDQFKQIHGPVAAGFCATCHQPHKSRYSSLLRMPVRGVCQHCHQPGDTGKNEAHQKTSKTACLACHNPHGGETVNLLRKNKTDK